MAKLLLRLYKVACVRFVGIGFGAQAGFITDPASVPRLPLVYLLLNGFADEPGVVHDYLYSVGKLSRALADKVLYEARILTGVSVWKASAIYAGVRVGGGSHWRGQPLHALLTPLAGRALIS